MLRRPSIALAALSLALPALAQEPPEGAYADFVPNTNGEPFSTWGESAPDAGLVTRIFALSFAETCSWALGGDPAMRKPEIFELSFRYEYDEPDVPDRPLMLYRFFCSAGAYNEQHVYMLWDGDNGLRPVSFPQPTYATELAEPDNPDSAVSAMQITGFTSRPTVTNSTVDPQTGTISSLACFRGICDASSVGTWVLDGPDFRLERFLVDPSYDGEENLIELVNYATPVDVEMTVVSSTGETGGAIK